MKKRGIVIMSVIGGVVLVVGVCSYKCVNYFTQSVKNMQIVLEDLKSGAIRQLTSKNTNLYPAFSGDGMKIYFLSDQDSHSSEKTRNLAIYSIGENRVTGMITPPEGIDLTSSVHRGSVVCYRKSGEGRNLCIMSLADRKIVDLANEGGKKTDALFSPDGKWISFIEEDSSSSRKNICIIPSAGGAKRIITNTGSLLADIKVYVWTTDSKNIVYISFLDLVVRSIDGMIIDRMDLTGLNNFKNILCNPGDPDQMVLVARDARGDLTYSLYLVSRKQKRYVLWKENRSFWEMFYAISPDGRWLAYSGKSE